MRRRWTALAAAVAGLLLVLAPPAAATPGPTSAPEYWFDDWHVQSLWDQGIRGQGVVIAEIDTGVNAALPELSGRVLRGKDFGRPGDGRVDREKSAFGHGTAMASIMVGRTGLLGITGLAPEAKVLPIAVPLNGTTDEGQPDHLPDAIRYAADHGAQVISMSVGGRQTPHGNASPCPSDEQDAVFHALRKGSIVLASVGNTGPSRNVVEEPGACLGVVSVGAVDRAGVVADFSTRQPYLTLTAPGVNVPSLGRVAGQGFAGDGTSQATAIASAAAALVLSAHPDLTGERLVARLLATLDARRPRPSPEYGYGRLDAYRAVTARVPAAAPNPVYRAAVPFQRRDRAFLAPVPPPGRLATHPPVPDRTTVPVQAVSGVDGRVVLGAVLAGAGLLALVPLLLGARRSRLRRSAPEGVVYLDDLGAAGSAAPAGGPVERTDHGT